MLDLYFRESICLVFWGKLAFRSAFCFYILDDLCSKLKSVMMLNCHKTRWLVPDVTPFCVHQMLEYPIQSHMWFMLLFQIIADFQWNRRWFCWSYYGERRDSGPYDLPVPSDCGRMKKYQILMHSLGLHSIDNHKWLKTVCYMILFYRQQWDILASRIIQFGVLVPSAGGSKTVEYLFLMEWFR